MIKMEKLCLHADVLAVYLWDYGATKVSPINSIKSN